jgi:hypothetical protein
VKIGNSIKELTLPLSSNTVFGFAAAVAAALPKGVPGRCAWRS